MTHTFPPPPTLRSNEVSIPATNPVSGTNLPRKWTRDAIRVCLDLGYTVSGGQAYSLLKHWRACKPTDVREFLADEFREWFLSYADPTGTEAVRNVMAGSR